METLVCNHGEPLVRRIVNFKLWSARDCVGHGIQPADVDDVCGTALCNLLARLERVKSGDNESAIRDFNGYVAVIAYNACNEHFRTKKPAWVRLSMKLRYLVTHAPQFGLWQNTEGQDVCGLAPHRGSDAGTDITHLRAACNELWHRQEVGRLNLAELVEAILEASDGPLLLEHLLDAVAECLGVEEARVQSLDKVCHEGTQRWEPSDDQPSAESRLNERQYLQRLWKEICDLPLEHRKALLLNLRDSAGGDIQLFDLLGIATIGQIAFAVEMEPLLFAELWKRLPLDDASIAHEMGLSRQDVRNRRSAARKRLARKMEEFQRGN
jgi:DNA-directed RNA polymerase specialized sigma24 family protein